jgi:hypothetical protein
MCAQIHEEAVIAAQAAIQMCIEQTGEVTILFMSDCGS